jgi:hypothetical protein
VFGGLWLSTRIHTFPRTISPLSLTGVYVADNDTRAVLLFVRLRSLLFEMCPGHPVALCETCGRTYTPEQLGTDLGDRCYLCHQCGGDLRESVAAHARTCPNLTPQKPRAALMVSASDATIPLAASERFAAGRRIRLGLGAHAAAR